MERDPQEIIAEMAARLETIEVKLKELKHAAYDDPIIRYYRGSVLFRLMDEMKAILHPVPPEPTLADKMKQIRLQGISDD